MSDGDHKLIFWDRCKGTIKWVHDDFIEILFEIGEEEYISQTFRRSGFVDNGKGLQIGMAVTILTEMEIVPDRPMRGDLNLADRYMQNRKLLDGTQRL